MKFFGYPRRDGRVGVRSHVLVIPTVICANSVAKEIARRVPGVVALPHSAGCDFNQDTNEAAVRILAGFGANPNVYAALVVGLGCETIAAEDLAERIARTGKPTGVLRIQGSGGWEATVRRGVECASRWLAEAQAERRFPCPLSGLVVALECGGSDAFSGLSANPAVGAAADRIVAAGGTVILSETTEMIGAEEILARRARDARVARRIREVVARAERRFAATGLGRGESTTLAPGNIAGGLTTIVEKSLGCILKGGTSEIVACVHYGERVRARGLVIMDTPGHDVLSVTGMVAGGANIVVFTTGRGTPAGCPIAPTIKVGSNSALAEELPDVIDINAGEIIEGRTSCAELGERIFQQILRVASGEQTWAERHGHGEFAMFLDPAAAGICCSSSRPAV